MLKTKDGVPSLQASPQDVNFGHPVVHYCLIPSLKIRWELWWSWGAKLNHILLQEAPLLLCHSFDIAQEYTGTCSPYNPIFMITVPWKIPSGAPRISQAM